MAEAHVYVGFRLIHARRFAEAERRVRYVLAVARSHGARRLIAPALRALATARYFELAAKDALNLAEVEFQAGAMDTALRLTREAVEVLRTNNDWAHLVESLCNYSAYMIALTRFDEARSSALEALISRVMHASNMSLGRYSILRRLPPCAPAMPLQIGLWISNALRTCWCLSMRASRNWNGHAARCAWRRSRGAHERRYTVIRGSGGHDCPHHLRTAH
jgi:tetratricopeptide (TPR) repeat protein